MKRRIITGGLMAGLITISTCLYAQMYYTATSSEMIGYNGMAWVEKKLPLSAIMFSDNSGEAELKTDISSLIKKDAFSVTGPQPAINSVDLKMKLDKQKIITQLYSGQVFNTTGFLRINNIIKPVTTQYFLRPAGDYENGFTISVIIRFVPGDFDLIVAGQTENAPILIRVDDGVVNEI